MAKEKTDSKQNIRYLGFEATSDGGRRFEFSITASGQLSTRVSLNIPAPAFAGANRITFQESAKICYEKIRILLEANAAVAVLPPHIYVTGEDIARLRHVPRGKTRSQMDGSEPQ